MKILVGIKRAVDANVKIRVNEEQSGLILDGLPMAINPFCEIALEQALRLREQGTANEILAVSIGTDAVQDQLRHCLALGADRALHIKAADDMESLNIAKLLKAVVDREQPGLVLLGKQAIDSDNNQVGQMLAALCDFPQGTFASKVAIENDKVMVSREVDSGEQSLELALPAVITTDLRLNTPRYARLPDIMKARRIPIECTSPEELEVTLKQHLRLTKLREPPLRQAGIRVDSAQALLQKLKEAGAL